MIEVYLPATAPEDHRFGEPPASAQQPGHTRRLLAFAQEVWYCPAIRAQCRAQLTDLGAAPRILIGFSKSGLGALSLALDDPRNLRGIVLFDSPLAHRTLPPWNTQAFYDQKQWEDDLPLHQLPAIRALAAQVPIVHIGGAHFANDHALFATALGEIPGHYALDRRTLAHRWDSGWLHEALALLR